jgi:lipopolysaccharide transport system permease protein
MPVDQHRHKTYNTTYNSKSWLQQPKNPFRTMWHDLLASRELAWRLLVRDIKAQYRQSFLGILWAFIPPLIMAAGFSFAASSKVINVAATDLPYPAYVMFSTTLWQTFVEALNGPIQAVGSAKSMMARINFPREAVILAKLGEVFFNFGIKLILIAGLFIGFRIPISWSVLLTPVALIHLVLLGTGLGLLLAPWAALYSDFSKLLPLIIAPWLLLTPVLYPVPTGGMFAWVVRLNPVTPLLVTLRELATTGVVSDPVGFWVASFVAIAGLGVAWIIYRVAMPYVVERVSS